MPDDPILRILISAPRSCETALPFGRKAAPWLFNEFRPHTPDKKCPLDTG